MESQSKPTHGTADIDIFRRMRIIEAMEHLLQKRTFGQITVTEICRQADISRPTFYHYFQDKYETAQWLWDMAAEKYLKECGRSLGWTESNAGMLRAFKEHSAFFAAANSPSADFNACLNYGYRQRIAFLEDVVRSLSPALLSDDLRFQIKFFVDAESRCIAQWNREGMRETPEVLARRIELCVPRELHDLVEMAHRQYRES